MDHPEAAVARAQVAWRAQSAPAWPRLARKPSAAKAAVITAAVRAATAMQAAPQSRVAQAPRFHRQAPTEASEALAGKSTSAGGEPVEGPQRAVMRKAEGAARYHPPMPPGGRAAPFKGGMSSAGATEAMPRRRPMRRRLGGGRAIATAVAIGGTGGEGDEGHPSGVMGGASATASANSGINARGRSIKRRSLGQQGNGQRLGGSQRGCASPRGPGQSFVTPGDVTYAFSTVLPDKADVATLIGGASNVADALLGPRDLVFGTAILGAASGFASSTFDFAYGGDLILGLIDGGGEFSLEINGLQVLAGDFFDDSVINLGSNFGPNIEMTIVTYGSAEFAVGGAVPEPLNMGDDADRLRRFGASPAIASRARAPLLRGEPRPRQARRQAEALQIARDTFDVRSRTISRLFA